MDASGVQETKAELESVDDKADSLDGRNIGLKVDQRSHQDLSRLASGLGDVDQKSSLASGGLGEFASSIRQFRTVAATVAGLPAILAALGAVPSLALAAGGAVTQLALGLSQGLAGGVTVAGTAMAGALVGLRAYGAGIGFVLSSASELRQNLLSAQSAVVSATSAIDTAKQAIKDAKPGTDAYALAQQQLAVATEQLTQAQREYEIQQTLNTKAAQGWISELDDARLSLAHLQAAVGNEVYPKFTEELDSWDEAFGVLTPKIAGTAGAVSQLVVNFSEWFRTRDQGGLLLDVVNFINGSTIRATETLTSFGQAGLLVFQQMIPGAVRLQSDIRDIANETREWVDSTQGIRTIQGILTSLENRFYQTLQILGDLTLGVSGFLIALDDQGGVGDMMRGLQGLSEEFRRLMSASGEGRAAVIRFMDDSAPVLRSLWGLTKEAVVQFGLLANAVVQAGQDGGKIGTLATVVDSLTDSLEPLRHLLQDTFVGLGPTLSHLIPQAAEFLSVFLGASGPLKLFLETTTTVLRIFNDLPDPVKQAVVAFAAFKTITGALGLGGVISGLSGMVTNLWAVNRIAGAVSGAGALGGLLATVRALSLLLIGGIGLAALAGALYFAYKRSKTFREGVDELVGTLKTDFQNAVRGVKNVVRDIFDLPVKEAKQAGAGSGKAFKQGAVSNVAPTPEQLLKQWAPPSERAGHDAGDKAGSSMNKALSSKMFSEGNNAAAAEQGKRLASNMGAAYGQKLENEGRIAEAAKKAGNEAGKKISLSMLEAEGQTLTANTKQAEEAAREHGRQQAAAVHAAYMGKLKNEANQGKDMSEGSAGWELGYNLGQGLANGIKAFFDEDFSWSGLFASDKEKEEARKGGKGVGTAAATGFLVGFDNVDIDWWGLIVGDLKKTDWSMADEGGGKSLGGRIAPFIDRQLEKLPDMTQPVNWAAILAPDKGFFGKLKIADQVFKALGRAIEAKDWSAAWKPIFKMPSFKWEGSSLQKMYQQVVGKSEDTKSKASESNRELETNLDNIWLRILNLAKPRWLSIAQALIGGAQKGKEGAGQKNRELETNVGNIWGRVLDLATPRWLDIARAMISGSDKGKAGVGDSQRETESNTQNIWHRILENAGIWGDIAQIMVEKAWDAKRGIENAFRAIIGVINQVLDAVNLPTIDILGGTPSEKRQGQAGLGNNQQGSPAVQAPKPKARGGLELMARGGTVQGPTGGIAAHGPRIVYGEAGPEAYVNLARYTPESAEAISVANETWARRGWMERIPHDKGGVHAGGPRYMAAGGTWYPKTAQVNAYVESHWPVSGSTYPGHGADGDAKNSVDWMTGQGWNIPATGKYLQIGNEIVDYLLSAQRAFTDYIIWQKKFYDSGGVTPYTAQVATAGGYPPPSGPSGYHTDHVHWESLENNPGPPVMGGGVSGGGGVTQSLWQTVGEAMWNRLVKPKVQDWAQTISGSGGVFGEIGAGLLTDTVSKIKDYIISSSGSTSGGGSGGSGKYTGGGSLDQWLAAGLKLGGAFPASASNVATLHSLAMEESTGNPNAVNDLPGNDDPSGLLQVKPSTFRQYMVPGHGDIFDPEDNTAASTRYQKARYGVLQAHAPYARGGISGRGRKVKVDMPSPIKRAFLKVADTLASFAGYGPGLHMERGRGQVTRGLTGIAGEAGKEAIVPLERSTPEGMAALRVANRVHGPRMFRAGGLTFNGPLASQAIGIARSFWGPSGASFDYGPGFTVRFHEGVGSGRTGNGIIGIDPQFAGTALFGPILGHEIGHAGKLDHSWPPEALMSNPVHVGDRPTSGELAAFAKNVGVSGSGSGVLSPRGSGGSGLRGGGSAGGSAGGPMINRNSIHYSSSGGQGVQSGSTFSRQGSGISSGGARSRSGARAGSFGAITPGASAGDGRAESRAVADALNGQAQAFRKGMELLAKEMRQTREEMPERLAGAFDSRIKRNSRAQAALEHAMQQIERRGRMHGGVVS